MLKLVTLGKFNLNKFENEYIRLTRLVNYNIRTASVFSVNVRCRLRDVDGLLRTYPNIKEIYTGLIQTMYMLTAF
jgi:hypothetical protein